jgi:hypothetical protein
MITQELLGYMRTEFAKGKAREEIQQALISSGGWSEDDLNEAFRVIIPMQNMILPNSSPTHLSSSPSLTKPISFSEPSSSSKNVSHPLLKFLIILIILGGLGFGFVYYRLPIMNFWTFLVNEMKGFKVPFLNLS